MDGGMEDQVYSSNEIWRRPDFVHAGILGDLNKIEIIPLYR